MGSHALTFILVEAAAAAALLVYSSCDVYPAGPDRQLWPACVERYGWYNPLPNADIAPIANGLESSVFAVIGLQIISPALVCVGVTLLYLLIGPTELAILAAPS